MKQNRVTVAQMAAHLLHDRKVVGLNLAGSHIDGYNVTTNTA